MKKQTFIEYSKVIGTSLVILLITSLFSMFQFVLDDSDAVIKQENSKIIPFTVVIDAGHGGEDPGAVGVGGSLEKDLNFAISGELSNFFSLTDTEIVLTRNSDTLLYKPGQENRKKFFDLRNRVEVAEKYYNPVFVSIHQNKFPIEKYHGFQVYYSKHNSSSKTFADVMQKNVVYYLQQDNKREIKEAGRNIYILSNLECPAVLVECGFLSNPNEELNLIDKNYQRKLSFLIFKSIVECSVNINSSV